MNLRGLLSEWYQLTSACGARLVLGDLPREHFPDLPAPFLQASPFCVELGVRLAILRFAVIRGSGVVPNRAPSVEPHRAVDLELTCLRPLWEPHDSSDEHVGA